MLDGFTASRYLSRRKLDRGRGLSTGSSPEHFCCLGQLHSARSGIQRDEFDVEATVIESLNGTVLLIGASVATRFVQCWRDPSWTLATGFRTSRSYSSQAP